MDDSLVFRISYGDLAAAMGTMALGVVELLEIANRDMGAGERDNLFDDTFANILDKAAEQASGTHTAEFEEDGCSDPNELKDDVREYLWAVLDDAYSAAVKADLVKE